MIAALCVVMVASIALAACGERLGESQDIMTSVRDMGAPKADAARSISADMSAQEMMEVGFYNYYAADFVVSENYSDNITKSQGNGTAFNTQYIDGYKIRKGVYSESDPLASDTYHLVIAAGSMTNKIEEALVVDGDLRYRIVEGGIANDKYLEYDPAIGMLKVKDFSGFKETDYDVDLEKYNIDVCNDPTKVFTYDIFDTKTMALVPGTIEEATDPVYDKDAGVYTFSADFDIEVATQNYIHVLERNLAKENGRNVRFKSLHMDFALWEDGHIKSISILEEYDFTMMAMTFISMSLSNVYDADVYFAYDESESGYLMSNYENAFTDNFGIKRNNEFYDAAQEISGTVVLTTGEIIGIIVGALVLLAAAITLIVIAVRRGKKRMLAEAEARSARADEEELFGESGEKEE